MEINYTLIRKKRKTISISVYPDGSIIVKAPKSIKESDIDKIIIRRAKWITGKLEEVKKRKNMIRVMEYKDGSEISYLGTNYEMNINIDKNCKVPLISLINEKMVIRTSSTDSELIKSSVREWYRRQAETYFKQRTGYYKKYIPGNVNRIFIKDQKTRWGSCSSKGNLNFNMRLMMAPADIVDYVVVHEMCHLIYMNHGNEFWKLVEDIMPDYAKRKNWLKENGVKLNF